jgi:class 3 adenylate cyclase
MHLLNRTAGKHLPWVGNADEIPGEKPEGIAAHIGAGIAAMAEADEVLVSSTVKDMVAGSGLQFEDRGLHRPKGVPGQWNLFRVRRRFSTAG